ncbi:MAG: SapC family protein [Magnetococcales bacterium]|nr:SapC family protein [Magnetococcales bacterium]
MEPLDFNKHKKLRFHHLDHYRFAAQWTLVPITYSEIVPVSRICPVVFPHPDSDHPDLPLALLSLDKNGSNLLLQGNGHWRGDYVPGNIRRYPFALQDGGGASDRKILLNPESAHFHQGGGLLLFNNEGEPTAEQNRIKNFLETIYKEERTTLQLVHLLRESRLLVGKRLHRKKPKQNDADTLHQGFEVLDADRLAALEDDVFLDWRRRGVLPLLYAHIASLNNIGQLERWEEQLEHEAPALSVARQESRDAAIPLNQLNDTRFTGISDDVSSTSSSTVAVQKSVPITTPKPAKRKARRGQNSWIAYTSAAALGGLVVLLGQGVISQKPLEKQVVDQSVVRPSVNDDSETTGSTDATAKTILVGPAESSNNVEKKPIIVVQPEPFEPVPQVSTQVDTVQQAKKDHSESEVLREAVLDVVDQQSENSSAPVQSVVERSEGTVRQQVADGAVQPKVTNFEQPAPQPEIEIEDSTLKVIQQETPKEIKPTHSASVKPMLDAFHRYFGRLRLTRPAGDCALDSLREARGINPDDAGVRAATEQLVTKLLELADGDIEAYRLSRPKGANAVFRITLANELMPGDMRVEQRLDAVALRYVGLALHHVERNREKGMGYLHEAIALRPHHPEVVNAQNQIQ